MELTVWPMEDLRLLSAKGLSNSPVSNLTRRIRVTASSILDMGMLPSKTSFFKRVVKFW